MTFLLFLALLVVPVAVGVGVSREEDVEERLGASTLMVKVGGAPPRAASSCSEATPRTLFVRRVHYVVHPRHDGKVVRRYAPTDKPASIAKDIEKLL